MVRDSDGSAAMNCSVIIWVAVPPSTTLATESFQRFGALAELGNDGGGGFGQRPGLFGAAAEHGIDGGELGVEVGEAGAGLTEAGLQIGQVEAFFGGGQQRDGDQRQGRAAAAAPAPARRLRRRRAKAAS